MTTAIDSKASALRRMSVRWRGLTVALALWSPIGAHAQEGGLFRDSIVGGGLHFQRWSGEEDLMVREFSLPVTFVLPLSR